MADCSIHDSIRNNEAAVAPNVRSPTVQHHICGTISLWVANDRRRCHELLSVAQCRSLGRYAGTVWRTAQDDYDQSEFNTLWGTQLVQGMSWSNGVTWSHFRLPCINLATALSSTRKSGTSDMIYGRYPKEYVYQKLSQLDYSGLSYTKMKRMTFFESHCV